MNEEVKKNVDHPTHYNQEGRKECIVEMREKFGDLAVYWFCKLNAYKYDYRAGTKDGNSKEQDTAKSQWYDDYASQLPNGLTSEDLAKVLAPYAESEFDVSMSNPVIEVTGQAPVDFAKIPVAVVTNDTASIKSEPKEVILITEEQIQEKVKDAARYIDFVADGTEVVIVGLLTGSFMFVSDVCRHVKSPVTVDFMKVHSYKGKESMGMVVDLDLATDIEGKTVIVIDDIVDTGQTLYEVVSRLEERNPETICTITLLDKPHNRVKPIEVDLSLFTTSEFVLGYGLDLDGKYRQVPYIFKLEEDEND